MAEQLAGAQQVEHDPVVNQLDRPTAHDADVVDRLAALREDRRAGAVELDLRRAGDLLDVLGREHVERGVVAQEVRDVGERSGRRDGEPPARGGLRGFDRIVSAASRGPSSE